MVERALKSVVVEALTQVAANGLPGSHHLYVTFATGFPGVELPDHLHEVSEEMTIVLQHQFWDLTVEEDRFLVTLSSMIFKSGSRYLFRRSRRSQTHPEFRSAIEVRRRRRN